MRIFSHTCSNTEIVAALGASDLLIGRDDDSDFPPEVAARVPAFGRDLDLRVDEVLALRPDLILTSLTVPGHERIVDAFRAAGIATLVCDPLGLDDVFGDIRRIADALHLSPRGEQLIAEMLAAMPDRRDRKGPRVLIEWWPKPVIAPTRQAWATDLIERAGGVNPWATIDGKSSPLTDEQVFDSPPDIVAISWCGVPAAKLRPDVVLRREGWQQVPAVRDQRVVAISEEYLGRPGPRLVEGYRRLRAAIEAVNPV